MIQEIADALVQSWRNFATAFVLFVPRLVAATDHLRRRLRRRAGRPPGDPALLAWLRLRSPGAAQRRQRDAAGGRDAQRRTADREDRLLDRLDRLHRVGGGHAAVRAVPGTGRGVLPVRAALPRRAAGARARLPGRQLPLARDAARVGERRTAGRAPAERRAARARHRHRRGDGARAVGPGDVRRADGVRDHVWRADAGAGDRVRPGRPRRRQAAARTAAQGARRERDSDAAPHL